MSIPNPSFDPLPEAGVVVRDNYVPHEMGYFHDMLKGSMIMSTLPPCKSNLERHFGYAPESVTIYTRSINEKGVEEFSLHNWENFQNGGNYYIKGRSLSAFFEVKKWNRGPKKTTYTASRYGEDFVRLTYTDMKAIFEGAKTRAPDAAQALSLPSPWPLIHKWDIICCWRAMKFDDFLRKALNDNELKDVIWNHLQIIKRLQP